VDANRSPLQKISEKIYRKPSRGGLPNVMYVQAAVEALPEELDGVADAIYVNFPWGSLLRGVAAGDAAVLRSLRRLCAPQATIKIVLGLDPVRDRSEIERLSLPVFDKRYLSTELPARYANAGLVVSKAEILPANAMEAAQTSWGKRLRTSSRTLIQIVANPT
jgi:16S rRNA (adenine(1408)-N(1))-methyltransferase